MSEISHKMIEKVYKYKDRAPFNSQVKGVNTIIERNLRGKTLTEAIDELRADKIIQQRAFKNPQIEFIYNSIPLEILGENTVTSIVIKNVKTNQVKEIKTNGVFPYIGFSPNADLFKDKLDTDEHGFINTNEKMETSIAGVFAAGDLRNTPLRQVITAASDGSVAATFAIKYLEEIK